MSIAKAIKVKVAARKDTREDIKVTVTWVERERRSAINVTAVAVYENEGNGTRLMGKIRTDGMDGKASGPRRPDDNTRVGLWAPDASSIGMILEGQVQ